MEEELLKKAELYISDLLNNNLSKDNYYHNLEHTLRVLAAVTELSILEKCNDQEIFVLKMATWFHDSGYTKSDTDHEQESVKIFHQFSKNNKISEDDTATIKNLILATKIDTNPITNLEKIIKDADCSHLASKDFFEISETLRLELQSKSGEKISKSNWTKMNLDFVSNHNFCTKNALNKWLESKKNNIALLEKKAQKKDKKKPKNYGKGVETMFRVTLKNHIQLSAIADTKANILLSVNAIIISVALSNLVPKLDNESNFFLVYPTLSLTFFSVASIILSILSTRPNISTVNVTKEMIKKNNTNILFFGNFHKMSLKDFEWGIEYLIDNEETLYNSLTKDLYYLGLVLKRKYTLLRITYNVFMVGIIISALSFVFSYYFNVR